MGNTHTNHPRMPNYAVAAVVVLAAVAASHTAPPPHMSFTNAINGFKLFNITLGAPGSCSCEAPRCQSGDPLQPNEMRKYGPAPGCDYFAVGGGITSTADGRVCNTFRADFKSCAVYPGSTDGACSRLIAPACSIIGTATTLHAAVDLDCDTEPWEDCTAKSKCCGSNDCR